jgi:hypothetical protein
VPAGETEVDQYGFLSLSQNDIRRLEIEMADAHRVHGFETGGDIEQDAKC